MRNAILVLAAALFVCRPTEASAQVTEGDVTAGRNLATAHCSECHAINGPARGGSQVPSFEAVARMPSTTSLSLHAFLLTPHPTMPNYRLAPQEIDDVVAYILSLRKR
jgi:mono/diheme cytochrome c family protein